MWTATGDTTFETQIEIFEEFFSVTSHFFDLLSSLNGAQLVISYFFCEDFRIVRRKFITRVLSFVSKSTHPNIYIILICINFKESVNISNDCTLVHSAFRFIMFLRTKMSK